MAPADSAPPTLVTQCLHAFGPLASLQDWRWRTAARAQSALVDGRLELRFGATRVTFAVVIRPSLREENLGPLAHLRKQVEDGGQHLLVCTSRVGKRLGAGLRELGIAYLDTTGTAWLEAAGVVVRITGRAPARRHSLRAHLTGTDLRLLHVLLRTGGTADQNHRQLAKAAGIALGAVGKGLRTLESRGLLRRRGPARWDIEDPVAAQAQFAEGWATRMRPRLDPRGYRALGPKWIEQLPKRLAMLGGGCLLGGELAAARLTDTLQTEHVTLHVPAGGHRESAEALALVADPDGPITLLERFGSGDGVADPERKGLQLAHPLLVHAELVAIGDERLAGAVEAVWRWWLARQESEGGR